jgi:hypothetical protein
MRGGWYGFTSRIRSGSRVDTVISRNPFGAKSLQGYPIQAAYANLKCGSILPLVSQQKHKLIRCRHPKSDENLVQSGKRTHNREVRKIQKLEHRISPAKTVQAKRIPETHDPESR